MNKKFLFPVIAILFGVLPSCQKSMNENITGRWEKVDVTQIEPSTVSFWDFDSGKLIIYKAPANDPAAVSVVDSAFYAISGNPLQSKLVLFDAGNDLYNGEWDIVKLNDEELILNLDIEGGVLFEEFIKIF
ncbi:MAG: hypothetical protein ACOCW7_01525 [Bacteroidota bacterium]